MDKRHAPSSGRRGLQASFVVAFIVYLLYNNARLLPIMTSSSSDDDGASSPRMTTKVGDPGVITADSLVAKNVVEVDSVKHEHGGALSARLASKAAKAEEEVSSTASDGRSSENSITKPNAPAKEEEDSHSEYPSSDTIDIVVKFDLPKEPTFEWRHSVLSFRETLLKDWKYGKATVTEAKSNMGLRKAWLEAWKPSFPETERAIIFEDDIEVSPIWYTYLRQAHEQYRDRSENIAGFSLQRQTLVPDNKARQNVIPDNDGQPFLYKLVGSIGYSPLASNWLDFLDFAECALASETDVSVPGLVTSDWYKKLDQRGMWTQLFIYFCNARNLYTLYYSPQNEKHALAAHWREKGEHFTTTKGKDFEIASTVLPEVYPKELVQLEWNARPRKEKNQLRSLILSAAVGYSYSEFVRFVTSLRRHYQGSVALLVSNSADSKITSLLKEHNILPVQTSAKGGPRASKEWFAINKVRWNFYQKSCSSNDGYDLCLALDFRDVIFQDDPFRDIRVPSRKNELHVYQHNLVMNDWHLNEAYGCRGENEAMKGQSIINAGGFMGTPSVFEKLKWVVLEYGKKCDDQVAFNLGLYNRKNIDYPSEENKLSIDLIAHKQGEGSINNVAWNGVFRKDSRDRILNHNCFPAPVVHQLDMVGQRH